MIAQFYQLERRRERQRDLRAMLALAIWGGGGGLLWLAWDARLDAARALPGRNRHGGLPA